MKGINYLNDYYANFKFDIKNDAKIEIWYDVFKGFDNDMFKGVIKAYCRSEVYPPQSPTHILQFAQGVRIQGMPTAESEWELVRAALVKHGMAYNKHNFYNELKPLTAETCREIEHYLATMSSDNRDFVRNDFIRIYNTIITRDVKRQLTGDDQLKLEEKK